MQESGGTRKTIEAGIEAIKALLPEANKAKRQTMSLQVIYVLACNAVVRMGFRPLQLILH
nr:UxaA family hydrolase [Polynucleobacter necessarius]